MPRPRRSARTTTIPESSIQPSPQPPLDPVNQNLSLLRKQWKWAAFTQFFVTFAHLFAMDDVSVPDIENDLVHDTNIILSRIMTRLLYTLSYDRRISLDNWQSALRRQYLKRDPQANPIGSEPQRASSSPPDDEIAASMSAKSSICHSDRDQLSADPEVASPHPESSIKDSSRDTSALPDIINPESVKNDNEGGTSCDWRELPMLSKLDSMHLLTEWQFQKPTRIRQIMRSDDEYASWRIEPIGYDSKHNAYWHIGDRLWIQRALPKPQKSLKRKRPATAKANGASKAKEPAKRQRIHSTRNQPNEPSPAISSSGRGRAAKAKAKIKLDAQARELAELNRQAALQRATESPGRKRRSANGALKENPTASRPLGTRLSARLRGVQGEEWQPIPEEWLNDNDEDGVKPKATTKTGLESDEDNISDLTELSEESRDKSHPPADSKSEPVSDSEKAEKQANVNDNIPNNFVEWETICVTLDDWEHIAENFEKASYYLEKALYKKLSTEIVPYVTEKLREIEKRRLLEEAISHRKRSSRIAMKESEKEEARLEAKRLAEENEKMGRERRLEARRRKEEEERLRRENAREQRRKEREAREAARKASPAASSSEATVEKPDQAHEVDEEEAKKAGSSRQNKRRHPNGHIDNFKSGTRTPMGDDWELDCEICHRHGMNLDDGNPMMSCGLCSRWQHIACHDQEDQRLGKPKRDWDLVEFVCRKCQVNRNSQPSHAVKSLPQNIVYGPSLPASAVAPSPYYRTSSFASASQPQYYADQGMQYGAPFNGTTPYTQGQVSDMRSSAPQTTSELLPRTTIAFSHYQPHDRAFTPVSKAHTPYNVYGNTQPYGQIYSQSYRYSDQRPTTQPITQV
ncbi:hypothetical protein BDQ17DRAFT_1281976 [Cyathus striatus]|nr:hypothetical protein BDQ17DRAFT_1281976 [Cyathus striatus]